MKAAIFAYSRQGCVTARKVSALLGGGTLRKFTVARLEQADFDVIPRPAAAFYGEQFSWAEVLIFIGSCGLAVREIAPHIKDKQSDPAVIVIDELGSFTIPLLSGHIGGANALAVELSEKLNSTAVITTATDINGRFSVDTWAAKRGYVIGNINIAKVVAAMILEADVPISSDFAIAASLPNGLVLGEMGDIGIYVGYQRKKAFRRTLQILPPVLHVGIGCRKGVSAETIEEAVKAVFEDYRLDTRAVKCAASIDLKESEPGLKEFAEQNNWELHFYSAEELMKLGGEYTGSPFVKHITGVDSVCERAAMLGADYLIVKKTAMNGVTVAVAAENMEVSFE